MPSGIRSVVRMWLHPPPLLSGDNKSAGGFSNCCGAIDGKHTTIQCPSMSGSTYFNYKHRFSIQLMAACDANLYRESRPQCRWRCIGSVRLRSRYRGKFTCLPPSASLPGVDSDLPYVFGADEAFPLQPPITRPYPGRRLEKEQVIYNDMLFRACRTIENAFWHVCEVEGFASAHHCQNEQGDINIVKAACALHNWLRTWQTSKPQQKAEDTALSNTLMLRGKMALQQPEHGLEKQKI